MDELVLAAMRKWPNVPACYGWLGLDARGHWYMRDAAVQACGAFDSGSPQAKGTKLAHAKLVEFIGRNYQTELAGDRAGAWFFQNGPQRVYVELESTPLILRVGTKDPTRLTTHCGTETTLQSCYTDEFGHVYALTEVGLGRIHTQDMHQVADAIDAGLWEPRQVNAKELPAQFGFCRSPLVQWGLE